MGYYLTGWLIIFRTESKESLYLEDPQTGNIDKPVYQRVLF